jgi:hypothetical protein
MTIMITNMMMVMNPTDRNTVMIIQTCCFGCHYNHNSRKCGYLHTKANNFFQDYANSKLLVHEPDTVVSKTGYKRDMYVLGIYNQENCTSRRTAALFLILEAAKQLRVGKGTVT